MGSDRTGRFSGQVPPRWNGDNTVRTAPAAKPANRPHWRRPQVLWSPGTVLVWPAATAKRADPRGEPQRWAMDAVRPGRVTASMGHRCGGNDIDGSSLRLPGPAQQHRCPIVAVRGRGWRRIARSAASRDSDGPNPAPGRPEPGPPLPPRNVNQSRIAGPPLRPGKAPNQPVVPASPRSVGPQLSTGSGRRNRRPASQFRVSREEIHRLGTRYPQRRTRHSTSITQQYP